jgi:hypothetical protein
MPIQILVRQDDGCGMLSYPYYYTTWLNPHCPSFQILSCTSCALIRHPRNPQLLQANTSWLLELMGQLSGILRKTAPGHQVDQVHNTYTVFH